MKIVSRASKVPLESFLALWDLRTSWIIVLEKIRDFVPFEHIVSPEAVFDLLMNSSFDFPF